MQDHEIAAALDASPSRTAYVRLWRTVCDVAHRVAGPGDEVVARVFALPLVIVTGSRQAVNLPGVIADIAEIRLLFEKHGVLGPTRNFGVGNALCSLETLERVAPSKVYAWTEAADNVQRELAPDAIELTEPGERVHLRFLAGAGITAAADPSFIESASNIGAWGMPLTRLLAAQLTRPGVDVLPLPRPPLDLLRARHAGRVAQLEAALNLFVSNAVRRFRAATGDPDAVISAHDNGEIRVSLSSPFDDAIAEGFQWPLHPLDDIDSIVEAVAGLLAECRVTAVTQVAQVLAAKNERGLIWFPKSRDAELSGVAVPRH